MWKSTYGRLVIGCGVALLASAFGGSRAQTGDEQDNQAPINVLVDIIPMIPMSAANRFSIGLASVAPRLIARPVKRASTAFNKTQ